MWKSVNECVNISQNTYGIRTITNNNGEVFEEKKMIATEFNKHFSTVGKNGTKNKKQYSK